MRARDNLMKEFDSLRDIDEHADIRQAVDYLTDQVKDFLDGIESEVDDIASLLNISSVADLAGLEEAKEKAEKLADDLY